MMDLSGCIPGWLARYQKPYQMPAKKGNMTDLSDCMRDWSGCSWDSLDCSWDSLGKHQDHKQGWKVNMKGLWE